MALRFIQNLTSRQRSLASNGQLGALLAFIAGAINAGGFLAVHSYTSHMTGIVSGIADELAAGGMQLALAGLASLGSFVCGAAATEVCVAWATRRHLHSPFAIGLLIEAGLLLVFGLLGANLALQTYLLVPATVLLLCFIMGWQNALVTQISQAEIRSTHMTGIVTDLGIELGRVIDWKRACAPMAAGRVHANHGRLLMQCTLLGAFFSGAWAGALMFKRLGFAATLPFAGMLLLMALPPLLWRAGPEPSSIDR